MTSKLFSKTVKKTTLMSVILAVILAAAVVVCALLGFNQNISVDDYKTLTVSMNKFVYDNNRADVVADCEGTFTEDARFTIEGETDGDVCEIIFVFDKDVDVVALKDKVVAAIDAKSGENGVYEGAFIDVTAATEVVAATLAKHFLLRAVIAGVVMAALVFVYAAIRYEKLAVGLIVGGNVALSMLLTAALVLLTRVPVTSSIAAVIAIAGLLTTALVFMTLGKLRLAKKETPEFSEEQLLVSSIPCKESLWLGGSVAFTMLLVGIVGKTDAVWFALASIIGVLSATLIALFYAPASYLSAQATLGTKQKTDYVGAKKTSTKEKRVWKKKAEQAPVEQVEQAPAVAVEEEKEVEIEETPVEREEPVDEPAEVEETAN